MYTRSPHALHKALLKAGSRRVSATLAMAAAILPLLGCGPKLMRRDFIGFEKAYAATSNREVLLNLARLQNHDTTYFFKLGQISSQYRTVASLSGNGSYVIQGTGAGGNATGGGTPSMSFENDPSFTFIPVNDETSAQLLLKPVPAETLYNLYLQGWRVDQLFRLMVDRIELTVPNASGTGCKVQTLRNVPPQPRLASDIHPDTEYLREASGYATFLRVSALVYGLQKHGHLLLKGTTTFVPFDTKSGIVMADNSLVQPSPQVPDTAKAAGGAASAGHIPPGDKLAAGDAPKAGDIASAAAKNQAWEFDGRQWVLGQQVFGAKFYLNPMHPELKAGNPKRYDEIREDVLTDSGLSGLGSGDALEASLDILAGGFSIDEPRAGGGTDDLCAAASTGGPSAHLVMRSLIGLMAAAAQEQSAFDPLLTYPSLLPKQGSETTQVTFGQAVPPIERLPALRLKWNNTQKSGAPLAEVNYGGSNFEIADAADTQGTENQYWNRDMFRLINQLTAQVTVDISKFPLPGILQLHSD